MITLITNRYLTNTGNISFLLSEYHGLGCVFGILYDAVKTYTIHYIYECLCGGYKHIFVLDV